MIVLSIYAETETDRTADALGRDRWGYWPGMSDLALYHVNHGTWVIGEERAQREKYALFVVAPEDYTVRLAVEIDRIEKVVVREADSRQDDKRVIHGRILEPGHPVYDTYVGKPSPLGPRRNPVGYLDSALDEELCRCGCGEALAGGGFIRGHEQTALHERVKQIGTVAEFIDWFDALRTPFEARR